MIDENGKLGRANGYVMHPEERAGASGPWLRERLKQEGFSVHPSSGLAKSLDCLDEFRRLILLKGSTGVRPAKELFEFFSESHGADFLTKALHWGYDSGLRIPRDRWKQLIGSEPNIAILGRSSADRNGTWETVIGSIARTFCSQVDFEEPDLICQVGNKKVAVAAKMIYAEKKILKRIIEGFRQAKLANIHADADAYLIFANVANIYPFFDVFKRTVRSKISSTEMKDTLLQEVTAWCDRLPLVKQAQRFARETDRPVGVGFFIPFTLVINGNPMPFFYVHMPLTWSVNSDEYRFAQKFLQACNAVLGYPHE